MNIYLIMGVYVIVVLSICLYVFWRRLRKKNSKVQDIKATLPELFKEKELGIVGQPSVVNQGNGASEPTIEIPGVEYVKLTPQIVYQEMLTGFEGMIKTIEGLRDEVRQLKESKLINPEKPRRKRIWTDEQRKLAGEKMRAGQRNKSDAQNVEI